MAKSRITPEQKARRAQLGQLMEGAGIKSMEDIQELFKDMIATFVNQGLEGELDEELGYSKYDFRNKDTDNSRNGHSEKTLKTSFGDVDIQVPRDRKGEFEPELTKKEQTTLTGDIEEKILSMYAKEMTTGDIEGHIKEINGLDVSDSAISRITDKSSLWSRNGRRARCRSFTRWSIWTRSISMCEPRGRSSRRPSTSSSGWTWKASATCWACTSEKTKARSSG